MQLRGAVQYRLWLSLVVLHNKSLLDPMKLIFHYLSIDTDNSYDTEVSNAWFLRHVTALTVGGKLLEIQMLILRRCQNYKGKFPFYRCRLNQSCRLVNKDVVRSSLLGCVSG